MQSRFPSALMLAWVATLVLLPSAGSAQNYSGTRNVFQRLFGLAKWRDQVDAVVRQGNQDSLIVGLSGPKEIRSGPRLFTERGAEYMCHVSRYDLGTNHTQVVVGNPVLAALYPGALVTGKSLHKGVPTEVNLPRAPLTISMWPHRAEQGSNAITIKRPTPDQLRGGVEALLRRSGHVSVAMVDHVETIVHSAEQAAIEQGTSIEWMGAGLSGQLNNRSSITSNTAMMRFDQVYYIARAAVPQHPSALFRSVTVGDLQRVMSPSNPLGMVTEVSYGRRAYLKLTGNHSSDKVLQAMKFAFQQAAAPKVQQDSSTRTQDTSSVSRDGPDSTVPAVPSDPRIPKLGAEDQRELERVLSSSTLQITILGGDGTLATRAVSRAEFEKFIAEDPGFSPRNPGYPLAYTVRNVADGDILRLGYATTFDALQCEPYTAQLRITVLGMRPAPDAGDGVHGEVFGNVTVDGLPIVSIGRANAVTVSAGGRFPPGGMGNQVIQQLASAASHFTLSASLTDRDGPPALDPDDPLGSTNRTHVFSANRWDVGQSTLPVRQGNDGVDIRLNIEELSRPVAGPFPAEKRTATGRVIDLPDSAAVGAGGSSPIAVAIGPGGKPVNTFAPELPPLDTTQLATLPTEALAAIDRRAVTDVPLDPSNGGRSIVEAALKPGDLIFSTTSSADSWVVRTFTGGGPVSHVRMYAGNGLVIESQKGVGVRLIALKDVLPEDQYSVAFRIAGLTTGQARGAIDFAMKQLGKPFDLFGTLSEAGFRHQARPVRVNLGQPPAARYYCSTLVLDALRSAGFEFATLGSSFRSPNDIVTMTLLRTLDYVGHLKTQ